MARPWYAPAPLRRGDLVRIVASSGAFDRPRFEVGLGLLRAQGWRTTYDPEVFAQHLYFAGPDARRQVEFERAMLDADARAIWCARGGYGAVRIVSQLNPNDVRRDPKWLIGFSDVTVLHCLWARAGVMSLHAANVHNLGTWEPDAREALFASLVATTPRVYQGTSLAGQGAARGRLLGGNLTVLASLAGTGLLPSWQGAVVFLEDVAERPYRLDRSITQLRMAGAFTGAVGVALGQLTDCEPAASAAQVSATEAIVAALQPLQLPILAGLPVGHEAWSQALLLGGMAILDIQSGTLEVKGIG